MGRSVTLSGSGYVYDLAGNCGGFSTDFSAVEWTDTLSSGYIGGYHTNSAGQVDVILLNDVTGNVYTYGKLTKQQGSNNDTATLVNSSGSGSKYVYNKNINSGYMGIALGGSNSGETLIAQIQTLSDCSGEEFFRQNDKWYVQKGENIYPISEQVEVHFKDADLWRSGADGLMSAVADGYRLTFYLDRAVEKGGQIRLVTAS